MRLFLTFRGENINLPLATAHTLQGLIYNALRLQDPVYSEALHEGEGSIGARQFKFFCFSELSGRYEIQTDRIIYPAEAHFFVSAHDPHLIELLFSYFNQNGSVTLGENRVSVSNAKLFDTPIFADSVTVRTLSPITVYRTDETGHTFYFAPNDDAFYDAVCQNAKRKWVAAGNDEAAFSLAISPAPDCRFKKRATQFKGTFITAYHGNFILTAPPTVLTLLYDTGLGAKNSEGFGMIEAI